MYPFYDIESVPDYLQLMKEYQKIEKSRISRPRTAMAPMGRNEEDFE